MSGLPMIPELGGEHAITSTDARIAWELAAEITDVPTILSRYGISLHEFKKKLQDRMFRTAIREAKALWKSDLNVEQRIRIKAKMLVEDSLLDIFKMLKNENMPSTARLESFSQLLKTADMLPKTKDSTAPGAGFKVNIILGDRPDQKVVIEGTTVGAISEETATAD